MRAIWPMLRAFPLDANGMDVRTGRMATGHLTIDLSALVQNWRALDAMTDCETAAVVKADGYGLGVGKVGVTLAQAGVRRFFVATAEEGATLRQALGHGPVIGLFAGHMAGDTALIRDFDLSPMLNSVDQVLRHVEALPGHRFGIQLDSGMNRLGLEAPEWAALREIAEGLKPDLIMSHLACADEPDHPMNLQQLQTFRDLTEGVDAPRSLAATGGILLGRYFHFDLTRPGVGLYGGLPFEDALQVTRLDLPVIQTRLVEAGETVGYGNSWTAPVPSRIATVSAGYADGLHRALGAGINLFSNGVPCPIRGRVSMDLITVDVTALPEDPEVLTILGDGNTVDMLAEAAGTLGYEMLTALGPRYRREYVV